MKDASRSHLTAAPRHTQEISLAFLVAALLIGHTMASMALLVLPAVAPVVAREYGIDASLIGYQISLVSAGMLVTLTLLGNITRRLGACRTNQIGHGAVGAGLLLMTVPIPAFLGIGAVVLGLGYGLIGPSFSHLLMRFSPPARRNFIFSLQQTGVPLGGVIAALVAPVIALAFGWRWAIALSVLSLGCVMLLMQRGRVRWDDDRDPKAAAVSINPLANFVMVWRTPPLRRVALAGGAFCWAQFCVAAYTVVTCVQAMEMSLIAAGAILTVVQISSAVGRVFVGWLADALHDTARVLAWNAALMFVTCVASIWMSPAWPLLAIYALFALHGITSGAWAGAVLAEAGRLAPQGVVSAAISGVLVYINIGKFIGPIVFANTYLLTRSYGWAFASIAIPALLAYLSLRFYKNINKNK
ncbi:MAG TPA: MFS transporter [Burkholderiales bacterium]|nr:MFS transporter [Burkholderiales bacterium]